ncbi:MAG: serine/threonine-protein kinase [Myxococcota bacterium]
MSAPFSRSEPEILADKYALLRKIGEGHAGVVHEAEHLVVGKRVAVKLFRSRAFEDTAARMRFAAETRAAARIAHPNAIDIHDLGVTPDGTPYLVMELLEGETLAELLRRKRSLPASQACELALQILAALAAAHRKGIIHGDLRPANVMVMQPRSDQWLVKVLDFGVSRALPDSARPPAGPPNARPYLAPEQLSLDPVDERSDVYACAAILFELLTGVAPNGPAPLDTKLVREDQTLPKGLAEVVERGLMPKRSERISSAEEFAEQLRSFLASAPASIPRNAAHTQVPVVARRAPGVDASRPPESAVMRVNLAPPLVTDSLLMSPRLPRAPAPPKLEAGKDFLPMLDDPERDADSDASRSAETRTPDSRKRPDPRPALLAMAVGFGIGIVIAWLAGLI